MTKRKSELNLAFSTPIWTGLILNHQELNIKMFEYIKDLQIKNPKGILLDEIDSGLDIDAVKDVAGFITSISNKDNAIMIVTHYSRILKYLEISKVHIIVDGKIVLSGDSEIIEQIDSDGYSQFQEG